MKWKTTQSLLKQCERHRTVSTITTYKNIYLFSIKSRAKVRQDLRNTWPFKHGAAGGISVGAGHLSGGEMAGGRGSGGCARQRIKNPQKGGF